MSVTVTKLFRFLAPITVAIGVLIIFFLVSNPSTSSVPEATATMFSDIDICPVESNTDIGEILFTVKRYGSCTVDSFGCVSRVELCTINANGTGLKQVALLPTDIGSLAWSPDREQIAFYLDINRRGTAGSPLYVKDIYDTVATEVVESFYPAPLLSWSPDGTYIAYSVLSPSSSLIEVFTVNVNDRESSFLIGQTSFEFTSPFEIAWSSSGQKLAFAALTPQGTVNRTGREIFVMNADGSESYQLTDNAWDDCCMNWTTDDQALVFLAANQAEGLNSLFQVELHALDIQLFFPQPLSIFDMPVWSSDGKMAIVTTSNSSGSILIFDVDRNDFFPLVNNEYYNSAPVWSPNGQQLLFLSQQINLQTLSPNNNSLYIVNADATGLTRLTHFPDSIDVGDHVWAKNLLVD